MIDKSLITLGIPVYNGEHCIEFTLKSISDALLGIQDTTLIEILVSDNMSTDNTSAVIQKFIKNGLNIIYHCNETNIGYDGNIDAIVKKANGKYVWFLGCGEKLKEDSLKRLVQKLDNDIEYTNILLDYDIFDEEENKISLKKVFSFDNEILLEDKNNFNFKRYDPSVSSNIINKESWLEIINEPLVVSGWCHVERILSMIADNDNNKTLLLPNPFYSWNKEVNGWWTKSDSYLFTISLIMVIKSMKAKGFNKIAVNDELKRYSRLNLVGTVISYKSNKHVVSEKMIKDFRETFKKDYFFWLFVLPILILPKQFDILPKIILKSLTTTKKVLKYVKKTFS